MINVEELAKEAERLRNGETVSVVQQIDPLILSLELEANNLRNNVSVQPQEIEQEENETQDIDYEDYEEEDIEEEEEDEYFGGFHNSNGSFIEFYSEEHKEDHIESNDILLCNDGTYCTQKRCLWDGESYVNPYSSSYKNELLYDIDNFAYDLKISSSYSKIVNIYGPTSLVVSMTQVKLFPNCWIKVVHGYVKYSDLERNNWIVENEIIKVDPKFSAETVKEKLLAKYPYFEQIVNSIFPEGEDYSWDYIMHQRQFCFVVKLKEVTITNSVNQKHVIRDLYVLLPFNNEFKLIGNLMGTRGEISTYENERGYLHSHLPGHGVSNFCLGSGPIKDYMVRFNLTPNENELFNVIYNIKIYSAWESIEGRPYRRISDLGKEEITENNSVSFNFNDLLKKYIKSDHQIPINLTTVNGVKTLVVNKNILEKQLVDFFLKTDSTLVYKDVTHDKYYSTAFIRGTDQVLSNKLFTFKGNDIFTTVKTYNNETKVQDQEFYAHPRITSKIQEWFTKRINEHIIQKETGFDPTKSTIISFD